MKIAIIGASGLLGRALFHEFEQCENFTVIGTALNSSLDKYFKLDLLDEAAVIKFVVEHKPNIIILAAAAKSPELCERNPSLARAMNVKATEMFAVLAKKINAWLLYISTDYVFDGQNPPYTPNSTPNPLNVYGQSKMEAEQVLWKITENACVLRLPILYGPVRSWDESAVTAFVPAMQNRDSELLIDNWAIRYPTYTGDVAVVCRKLIEYKMKHPEFKGTFHWSGQEALTKYQMALIMAEYLQINMKYLAPQSHPSTSIPRPFDCHLDSTQLELLGMKKRISFRVGIQSVIEGMKIGLFDQRL